MVWCISRVAPVRVAPRALLSRVGSVAAPILGWRVRSSTSLGVARTWARVAGVVCKIRVLRLARCAVASVPGGSLRLFIPGLIVSMVVVRCAKALIISTRNMGTPRRISFLGVLGQVTLLCKWIRWAWPRPSVVVEISVAAVVSSREVRRVSIAMGCVVCLKRPVLFS